MKRSNCTNGFSLLEVLMCIGIVGILCVLLFPVIASARRSGHAAAGVSNLRQLGIAFDLYSSENDGSQGPLQAEFYVNQLRLPAELLANKADPTVEGYANTYRRYRYRSASGSYRVSLLSKGLMMPTESALSNQAAPRSGWVILPTSGRKPGPTFLDALEGGLTRLCFDGSVVSRQFLWHEIEVENTRIRALSMDAAFADVLR